MAENRDYTFKRGDTCVFDKFRLTFNGEPIELSDKDQIFFTMKESYDDKTMINVKKKIGDGIYLKDDGYYHLVMRPEDTEELPCGKYMYDIQFTHMSPVRYVKTIIEGTVRITKEITRREDEY